LTIYDLRFTIGELLATVQTVLAICYLSLT
jgi:hypothetical protein